MFFSEKINIRLRKDELKKIKKLLKKSEKYENVSHFIRCAILKLIKEEEEAKR